MRSLQLAQAEERFDAPHQDMFVEIEMIAVQGDAGPGAQKHEHTGDVLQIPGEVLPV